VPTDFSSASGMLCAGTCQVEQSDHVTIETPSKQHRTEQHNPLDLTTIWRTLSLVQRTAAASSRRCTCSRNTLCQQHVCQLLRIRGTADACCKSCTHSRSICFGLRMRRRSGTTDAPRELGPYFAWLWLTVGSIEMYAVCMALRRL
jgi:hypothetical protein